jgi:hypothetical protein
MNLLLLLSALLSLCFFCTNASVSDDGLVGMFLFNGNAHDDSVQENDGSIINNGGIDLCNDRFGYANYAYCFNGGDNYIRFDGAPFAFTQNFTVSLWMYVSSAVPYTFTTKQIFSTSNYGFQQDNNAGPAAAGFWYSSNYVHSAWTHFLLNQWNHVVITKGSDYLSLYVNNALDAYVGPFTASESAVSSIPSHFDIGHYFIGRLDDFYIYNRELSSSEVASLYSVTVPAPPSAAPTVSPTSAPAVSPTSAPTDAGGYGDSDSSSSSSSSSSTILVTAIVVPTGAVVIGILIYISYYFCVVQKNNTSPASEDDLFYRKAPQTEMMGKPSPSAPLTTTASAVCDDQMPSAYAKNVTPTAPSVLAIPSANSYSSLIPSTTYHQNPPVYYLTSNPPTYPVGTTYPMNNQMTSMTLASPTFVLPTTYSGPADLQVIPYSVLSESSV